MYCPECGAEYRPIATVCSDCQVALVPNPPSPTEKDSASQADYIVLVWSGSNPAERAVVQEALERENIPVRVLRREDTILPLGHAPIEIYVPSSFAERATEILNQLDPSGGEIMKDATKGSILRWSHIVPADEDDTTNEILAEDDLPQSKEEYRDLQHWNPENATVELWAGQDPDLASMIRVCLRENQIPCRSSADKADGESEPESANIIESSERLYVLPEDEARAKEILREIVDAVPPQ